METIFCIIIIITPSDKVSAPRQKSETMAPFERCLLGQNGVSSNHGGATSSGLSAARLLRLPVTCYCRRVRLYEHPVLCCCLSEQTSAN